MNRFLRLTLALGAALAAGAAHAETATAQFQVTATVVKKCKISATTIAFGNYDPATILSAEGTLTLKCTKGTLYSVALDGGSTGSRQMTQAAEVLDYELYSDAGHTAVWPSTAAAPSVAAAGADEALIIFAQVPADQYPAPGAYADTVTATINY
ncbi:spore coat U domain-containing protein [Anaeromyxobacter sp. Fw109-5]|uniref:Csu type fimbrial protein n=1 Tax=Anaeromyxobacter sp. (strain Fw109-5) TaxID=404589 RepID=UPI0000ED78BF|nr:spore coat U domain-containing protein [Anaeromyxobacter sp. Fw109-5]ABS24752.1 Spore coat U domain protein [Anaeromyxobacter sp. Fw109-5]